MEHSAKQPAPDEMRPAANGRSRSSELARSGRASGYITFDEFVRRVPLSASTIRRRLKDGSIPSVQPGGKGHRVLIREDALDVLCQVQPAESSEQEAETQRMMGPDAVLSIAALPTRTKLSGPSPKWKSRGKFRR